jgi:hypothetical protein
VIARGNDPATMKSVLQPCKRVFRHSVGMPVAVLLLLLLALVGCSGGGAADQQSASGAPPTPTPTCFRCRRLSRTGSSAR